MKLIRQTKLVFQEGRSDKVYEVDLCEIGANRYVVNFRYGRRGANLKEGAKTANPVSLAEAEKVFASLVAEKTKKGYKDSAGKKPADIWGAEKTSPAPADADEVRKQAVLKRLEAGDKTSELLKKKNSWPLERAIWRAGELKIKEAAPLLVNLMGTKDTLRDYCIAWALGFCGDEKALPALARFHQKNLPIDSVKRIACEALLKLSDAQSRADYSRNLIDTLPLGFGHLARSGPADDFQNALQSYLEKGDQSHFQILDMLYLIDNEYVRPALLHILRAAPMKPNYFRSLRHIFKAAEYRRDAEVFGIIAYRFEKTRANFNTWNGLGEDSSHSQWIYIGDRGSHQENYVRDGRKEIQSPTSRIAYGSHTRVYFRNRVWRTLRRLGELGDLDYVRMAVGVLLPFSQADAQPVRESVVYNWRERQETHQYWDTFAAYKAFNHILYTNSPRYFLFGNSVAWRCRQPYKPGDAAPANREEAFPRLWEQRPEGLLHLLAESSCRPVIEFAARALAACEGFCSQLDIDTILMILERPYQETARLGFRLAKQRYNALAPDRALTLALVNCSDEEARAEAQRWIKVASSRFISDSDFVAALVFSNHADTRDFTRSWLGVTPLSSLLKKALVEKLIIQLITLSPSQDEMARDVADLILQCFAAQLRVLPMRTILPLLKHRMVEVQEFGGNILLNHHGRAADLPEEVIQSLIASPFETSRAIGMKLFGQLDAKTLCKRDSVIAALATHELVDIRNAVHPVIHRLCNPAAPPDSVPAETRKQFSLKLASRFLDILFAKELYEGIHSTLVKVMREDLHGDWMQEASPGTAWKLIGAKSQAAQELGGILMSYKAREDSSAANNLDFSDLVELTNHEVRAVRESSWELFPNMLHRLKANSNPAKHVEEMAKAIHLLDAKWDDSRDFWFSNFDVQFNAEDYTPAILVSICDSVRPDVQAFGRQLIRRFFKEAEGQEYLLKLSEHPSADLQLFATNYLEQYATDSPQRLRELKYYFLSVLSRVNKARIAKSRVLAFLTNEAQKSEEAARLVAEILTRQSLTMAIGDKAAAIEAMLKIHRAYPQVAMPLQVKQPEVRNAL